MRCSCFRFRHLVQAFHGCSVATLLITAIFVPRAPISFDHVDGETEGPFCQRNSRRVALGRDYRTGAEFQSLR